MKHATINVKAVAKPKLKSLGKQTAVKKTKSVEKIASTNIVLRSPKKPSVAEPKFTKAKGATSATAKPKIQKVISKKLVKVARVEGRKIQSPVAAKKSKTVAKKTIQTAANGKTVQKKTRIKPVIFAKSAKSKTSKALVKSAKIETSKTFAPKTKTLTSVKKFASVGKKERAAISIKKVEQKAKQAKPKTSVKDVKTPETKHLVSPKNVQTLSKKTENIAVISKPKNKAKKIKPFVPTKKNEFTVRKSKPILTFQTVETKQAKSISFGKKAEIKSTKTKPIAPVTKVNAKSKAVQLIFSATTGKAIKTKAIVPVNEIKSKIKKVKLATAAENVKAAVKKVETVDSPPKKDVKKKKVKPIGTAIFRGKKDKYDFKVFSIKEEIENVPAIFIISKRKTDHQNRGHHALVCIGQTNSISDEIKKHQKSKCLKKHDANVISILPEENEKKRLKIEIDLRAAHAIPCVHA